MRSLIIGASSFSGTYMCRYLHESQIEFAGTKLPAEQPEAGNEGTILDMDLRDQNSIRRVLNDYDPEYIFNFAEQSSVGRAWAEPKETVEVNVNGVLNLFEAVRMMKRQPVVVLTGAGEEYGRVSFDRMPIEETENLHPGNIYAATKACQTMLARIYHKAYGMNLIVARTFNAIGPGQSESFAISNFCQQAALIERNQIPPVIYIGNPNIQRDFVDIRDIVRASFLLGIKGKPGQVYNIGTGQAVRIWDVLEHLKRLLPADIQICVDQERIRPVDVPKFEGSIHKLQQDTGWTPEISLEQSVRDMLQYWRDHVGS